MEFIKATRSNPKEKLLPNKGALRIRAYCAKCGKLLQESTMMSKKQLMASWDRAVLGAVNIKCDDCGLKFPNFDINLKIYNVRLDREHSPEKYIKISKGKKETPEELFNHIANKWKKEHPELQEVTSEEVQKALDDSKSELLGETEMSKEDILKIEVEKRKNYYGKGNE